MVEYNGQGCRYRDILSVFLITGILWQSQALGARELWITAKCRKIVAKFGIRVNRRARDEAYQDPYQEKEFQPSAFWFAKQNPAYPKWAVDEANKVTQKILSRKHSYKDVLDAVAESRQRFQVRGQRRVSAYEPPDAITSTFGAYRDHPLHFVFPHPTLHRERYAKRTTVEKKMYERAERRLLPAKVHEFVALQKNYFSKWGTEFDDYDTSRIYLRQNTYQTLDGQELKASQMVRFESKPKHAVIIIHPDVETSKVMLEDALKRLSKLRRTTVKDRDSITQFAYAMYGFYQSMPFKRGGSAIGRSYFAGAYRAIFGKKIPPLPDGTDVMAMTALTPKEFVDEMVPLLMAH